MSEKVSKEAVVAILKQVKDPELDRDIVSLGMLKNAEVTDGVVEIKLEVTTPNPDVKKSIENQIEEKLRTLDGIKEVNVYLGKAQARGVNAPSNNPIDGIHHVVAVASGKGGVGKSTVSVNLAISLAQQGFKVGLMDGDIYGPNIPLMLGVAHETRPGVNDEDKIVPIQAQGISMISMGVMVPPDQPMVWRGPMLHSAVTQFLQKVAWGNLDYLLVDLPPGTGDVQLSLVQNVPLSGAVIVTTPQEVALMDVRKGVAMFQKTNVPILGVIENMTGDIFGEGGGKAAADQFKVPFLGGIPLNASIRKGGDAGEPIVISEKESEAASSFKTAASHLAEQLEKQPSTV